MWSHQVATEIPRVSLRTDFGWFRNWVLRSEGALMGSKILGPQAVRDLGEGRVHGLISVMGLALVGVVVRPRHLWV